jgi:hypothetical protein
LSERRRAEPRKKGQKQEELQGFHTRGVWVAL